MHVPLEQRQACPGGTHFYTCANPQFRGCCAVDPCRSQGCPSHLYANTLPPSTFSRGPPASSPVSTLISTTQQPSSIETIASVEEGETVYITVTHAQSTTARTAVATPIPQPVSQEQNGNNSNSAGPIAGGVIGGLALLSAILFIFFLYRRKKRMNERKRATLPPPYSAADTDMSEELQRDAPTASSSAPSSGAATMNEKAGLRNAEGSLDAVPQLDSTMIRPTAEIGGDPLGNIAELPASVPSHERDPTNDQGTSIRSESSGKSQGSQRDETDKGSWTEYNSLGNRHNAARLSQPHGSPDTSSPVWDNMSGSKNTGEPPNS